MTMTASQPILCCKAIPPVATRDVADSMAGQMLITEYYDGAIEGFLQCSLCLSVYHFVTLDWSQNHFIRVIALSLVPSDSMAKLVSFFAEVPPKSHWIPRFLQRATDQDLDRIEAFLSEIIPRAEPPSIVLAWNILTNEILSARRIGALSADQVVSLFDADTPTVRKKYDWFGELAISQDE